MPHIAAELAGLTLDLCSVPSETGSEREIADRVEARCRELAPGGRTLRIGNSVVCVPEWSEAGSEGPVVALVGHLDTVKCAEGQTLEIRDGRVYGCGATDMKGGLAAVIAALRAIAAEGLAPRVDLLSTGDEEDRALGQRNSARTPAEERNSKRGLRQPKRAPAARRGRTPTK